MGYREDMTLGHLKELERDKDVIQGGLGRVGKARVTQEKSEA